MMERTKNIVNKIMIVYKQGMVWTSETCNRGINLRLIILINIYLE